MVADGRDRVGHVDLDQRGRIHEGTGRDAGHVAVDGDARNLGTAHKITIAAPVLRTALQAGRIVESAQRHAALEHAARVDIIAQHAHAVRQVRVGQSGAIVERAAADDLQTIVERHVHQARASREGILAQLLQVRGQGHRAQAGAVFEDTRAERQNRVGQLDAPQAGAAAEDAIADGFDGIGHAHVFQAGLVLEHVVADGGDLVVLVRHLGDHHDGARAGPAGDGGVVQVGILEGELLHGRDDLLVGDVVRGAVARGVDARQTPAHHVRTAFEGIRGDVAQTLGEVHAPDGAVRERLRADGGDALRQLHLVQRGIVHKGLRLDLGQVVGQGQGLRQAARGAQQQRRQRQQQYRRQVSKAFHRWCLL